MVDSTTTASEHSAHREGAAQTVGAGSSAETTAGLGAIVLALMALVGVLPLILAAIATIASGAGLLLEGAAVTARYSELRLETASRRPAQVAERMVAMLA
jgi:hypothetical protein